MTMSTENIKIIREALEDARELLPFAHSAEDTDIWRNTVRASIERVAAALQAIEEEAPAPPAQGWVSVDERLPEHGQGVLVALDTGPITVAYLMDGPLAHSWNLAGSMNDIVDLKKSNVTHWQSLPPPPSEGADKT